MEILLIRHGESLANRQGLVCGQLDSPLTDLGMEQALLLKDKITDTGYSAADFGAIYVSSLKRARQTAELVFPGRDLIIEPGIVETNTGKYSELTVEELHKIEPRFQNHGKHLNLCYPEGETILDLYKRIIHWFKSNIYEIKSPYDNKIAVIVAHAGTANCILHWLYKRPLDDYPFYAVRNASYTHLRITNRESIKMLRYDVVGY